MATSVTRNVSVRLVVVEGDKAIRTINNFGDIGDRAIKKIVNATAPASKGLMAVSVVSEQVRFGLPEIDTDACLALAFLANSTTAPQIFYAAGFAER